MASRPVAGSAPSLANARVCVSVCVCACVDVPFVFGVCTRAGCSLPFFKSLNDTAMTALLRVLKPIHCAAGDILIEAGTEGSEMFFLISGQMVRRSFVHSFCPPSRNPRRGAGHCVEFV